MANTRTLPAVVVAAAAIVCTSAPRIAEAQVRETGLTLEARFGPEFTESFSRTIQASPSTTLDLSTESGDVVITGGGGTELRIGLDDGDDLEVLGRTHGVHLSCRVEVAGADLADADSLEACSRATLPARRGERRHAGRRQSGTGRESKELTARR